jgi:prepilin-type N-terminal cleavage/methylation domain-containing protein
MSGSLRTEGGFTLLEVLVALVILIIGLAAYYFAFGSGLLAGASSDREWRAAQAAENLVAQMGRSIPIDEGIKEGDLSDGGHWTVRIEPFNSADPNGAAPPLTAHIVTLDVAMGGARADPLRLQTLIIAARSQ